MSPYHRCRDQREALGNDSVLFSRRPPLPWWDRDNNRGMTLVRLLEKHIVKKVNQFIGRQSRVLFRDYLYI